MIANALRTWNVRCRLSLRLWPVGRPKAAGGVSSHASGLTASVTRSVQSLELRLTQRNTDACTQAMVYHCKRSRLVCHERVLRLTAVPNGPRGRAQPVELRVKTDLAAAASHAGRFLSVLSHCGEEGRCSILDLGWFGKAVDAVRSFLRFTAFRSTQSRAPTAGWSAGV